MFTQNTVYMEEQAVLLNLLEVKALLESTVISCIEVTSAVWLGVRCLKVSDQVMNIF